LGQHSPVSTEGLSDFEATETPADPTESAGSEIADLDPEVNDLEDPDPLSEQEETLSESEASASEAGSAYGLPVRSRMIILTDNTYRAPSRVKDRSGAKVAAVCGVLAKDCRKHAKKRIGLKAYQYPVGFYHPVHAARGSRSYGSASAPRYTEAEMVEIESTEREEASHIAEGVGLEDSEPSDWENLARDVRIRFANSPQIAPTQTRPAALPPELEKARKSLAASLESKDKTKNIPLVHFGIQEKDGSRWLTVDPTKARMANQETGSHLAQIFTIQDEAEGWARQPRSRKGSASRPLPMDKVTSSSNESEGSTERRPLQKKKKKWSHKMPAKNPRLMNWITVLSI
jgi:hypothetical protein